MNMRQHKRRYFGRFCVWIVTWNGRPAFVTMKFYDRCNPRAYGA